MHIDAKFVSTNMYHVGVITNYVTMLAWSVSTSNETQDYGYVASCPLLHVSKDAGAPRHPTQNCGDLASAERQQKPNA